MPSGNLMENEDLEKIVKMFPRSLVYVDQAYFGFEYDPIDVNYYINKYDNVLFGRTFSKFFALAGLRLGYGIASKRALDSLWLDFPLLRLPIMVRNAAIKCLEDDEYYDRIRGEIKKVKEWFYNELTTIGDIHPYKSDTNFIYMKISGVDGKRLREEMIRRGYLLRLFEYNDNTYFRINVAPMDILSPFIVEFKNAISGIREAI